MWEFAHLSDHFKTINSLDRVPRVAAGNLYIGGIGALHEDPDPLQTTQPGDHKITHILSAIDHDVREKRPLTDYQHLWLQVEDSPDENLLKHFSRTNEFIESGLNREGSDRGGVFVHCAMGVSRSATIVCAYLMWKGKCSAEAALQQLREGRRHCQPNSGFMQQLRVYGMILEAQDEGERERIYGDWVKQQYSHDRERLDKEMRRPKL
jgi:dual specificity phosphatase 12